MNLPDDPLTVNTGYSTDLARHIKTTRVTAEELQIGDVVVDDHSVWHVAKKKIHKEGKYKGTYEILDGDDNGGFCDKPDSTFTIIERDCLK